MNSVVDLNQLKALKGKYCNSLNSYSRFVTREVKIGDIAMGAHHPIRIQSMTTTDTMDTIATVEQTIRMVEAGCEYVRITAPSMKEAQNLAEIKKELRNRGYNVPLIADIHFTPNAAELAARIIEKVRVNPGNYIDKKKFQQIDYTDSEYMQEVERIQKRFSPLVKICKEYGTAMRIGTNHGSLSDRIMSRYGDTPMGMVESAMEFMRICADLDYHNLVISMKASNPKVMVQAYRMLVEKMVTEGMNYPLHLGVTEAGDGEDGRIKSAVGIGTLLEDGLGDTIRVSLTEEPEFEAPVAAALAKRYELRAKQYELIKPETDNLQPEIILPATFDPYSYKRRKTHSVENIGDHNVPRVIIDLSNQNLKDPFILSAIGYNYSATLDKYNMNEQTADFAYLGDALPSFSFPGNLKQIYNYSAWKSLSDKQNAHPIFSVEEYLNADQRDATLNFIETDIKVFFESSDEVYNGFVNALKSDKSIVLILITDNIHGMAEQRQFIFDLLNQQLEVPIIIKRSYSTITEDDFMLDASTDIGALLTDGLVDGLWLQADEISSKIINSVAFGILQATRTRISKTEYISCPSCGRTLFDLQETTQLIRSRTDHLKGIKIGIMGCIVNGPGEMADADYGYVGTGPGVITLYKEKEVVKRNVPAEKAVDELINLIKEHGDWVEPLL